MKTSLLVSSASIAMALSMGCGSSNEAGPTPTPEPSSADIARSNLARTDAATVPSDSLNAAVAANNAFAVDLYGRVVKSAASGNVLTSPISASLALGMAYAGAAGRTATEMARALHLGDAAQSVFEGQNALSQALASRGQRALSWATEGTPPTSKPSADDYQFQVVNSIWGEKTYTWEQPFLDVMAVNYGTGVYQQDFIHQASLARDTINAWVSEQTAQKINGLLPSGSIDPTTRMVLVNAVHLKFPWANTFQASLTAPGDFTRSDGARVSADFMHLGTRLAYVDDGQAQIVALPLSRGELSVVIALPHEGVDLTSYEAALTPSSSALSLPSSTADVDLSLPKTNFTSPTFSLRGELQGMGMNDAFSDAADFSGLCAHPPNGEKLSISDVVQKTMLSMQESGIEAAAATAVITVGTTSAPTDPPTPIPVVVNRPYLVSIVDGPTGAILFIGHVDDPTDAGSP